MAAYPHLRKFAAWLLGTFLPFVIVAAVSHYVGFQRGHDAGRLEMKCAVFAIVERLGDVAPVPGTISLGCTTVKAKAVSNGVRQGGVS